MNDNNPLGIEYRVVDETERDGQPARIVSGTRIYSAEAEELWDALTNADRISHWFLPITGELNIGGRYQLKGNAGGEILRCDRPNTLEVSWECADNVSWVTVRLEPADGGTRLTLEQIMLKDEASEARWKKYGPGATGVGWELGFLGLGQYLVNGDEFDREESNTWMTSEDGKSFIRQSAQAWGEMHIESGEDANIARAMAEETARGYCGE